jgi:ABC-2 type transport system permease protein
VIANVTSLVAMTAVALIVGWRIHSSPQEALLGFLLLLLFAYALSWVMAVVALMIRTPEAYNSVAWMVIFPLSFIANTFVDSTRLPRAAEGRRRMEPRLGGHPGRARALRQHPPGDGHSDAWPLQHPVLASLLWTALILAVFVPLGTWRYKKAVSR